MTTTAKQGYIYFSDEWEHVDSQHVGPFVTKITHRNPDGALDVRTSRRHRKHFGPEKSIQEKKRRYFGWQPQRIDFWATFPLFIGTLFFNVLTFMGFFALQWYAYDIFTWIPNFIGSVLFLIAGTAGVLEFCHHFWCWQFKNVTWWIVTSNLLGCVFFMISAFAAFSRPDPIGNNLFFWATFTTLLGAICFFVSSYLMWPEMAAEEKSANT